LGENGDPHLMGLVCSNIGYVFNSQDLPSQALPNFQKAYQCDSLLRDTVGMVFDLRDMGNTYKMMQRYENAMEQYQTGANLALAAGDSSGWARNQAAMAKLFYLQGKFEESKQSIANCMEWIPKAVIADVYVNAARTLYQLGETDSAAYYFNELLAMSDIYSKETAYYGLAKVAMQKGDAQQCLDYLKGYWELSDSVVRLNESEQVAKAAAAFNYRHKEAENALLKAENTNKRLLIAALAVISLLLAALLCLLRLHQRRKEEITALHIQELRRLIAALETESKEKQQANEAMLKKLGKMLIEIPEASLRTHAKINDATDAPADIMQREQKRRDIAQASICQNLKDKLAQGSCKVSESEWNSLEQTVETIFPHFSSSLKNLAEINEQDFHVCLLLKAGFSPNEIGLLTHHSPQSISSSRSRLFKKVFGTNGGARDWDKFIETL